MAQRDNDGALDPGFHYDPIDWALSGVTVTGTNVTIRPGTAICSFGNGAVINGLTIGTNATLQSIGTAALPVRVAGYNCVQEQASTSWTWGPGGPSSFVLGPGSGTIRFTEFYGLGGNPWHIYSAANCATPCAGSNLSTVTHSQFYSGGVYLSYAPLSITNSLFDTCYTQLYAPNTRFINCTFHSGWFLPLSASGYDAYNVTNSLFERVSISQSSTNVASGYNAYENFYNRLSPTNASDVILSSAMTYTTGTFGRYYQTVTNLVDRGSASATNFSLYHFTARSTEATETTSTVDIGFHYPAGSGGSAVDTDGDGIPDYLEDANGNGTADTGETSWTTYDSLNGLSGSSDLRIHTPLRP